MDKDMLVEKIRTKLTLPMTVLGKFEKEREHCSSAVQEMRDLLREVEEEFSKKDKGK